MRTLEEQVPLDIANRLRVAQESFNYLRIPGRASAYYIFEISRSIDGGMLLGALVLGSSLLEIWVRDLLVIRKASQKSPKTKAELRWHIARLDKEIEGEKRGLSFRKMLRELVELNVIEGNERNQLEQAFTQFRNPLMHGISGRFLGEFQISDISHQVSPTREQMLLANIFASVDSRSRKIEEIIDYEACDYLEAIVNFVAAHPLPDGV